MANQQTRGLRKIGLSTYVIKGASVPKDGKPGLGQSLGMATFPLAKGEAVNSSRKDRFKNGKARKPWKGCGNPLGRDGVQYEVPTGSVVK